MSSAESEARRALARLLRTMEKADRDLAALRGALSHAEGDDFPEDVYQEIERAIARVIDFTEEEGLRLQEKILHAGGLEPGRIRRGDT